MNDRDELIKQIGEHVLSCFEDYTENPWGKNLVIPIRLPKKRVVKEFSVIYPRFDDWVITVAVSAPSICVVTGPGIENRKYLSARKYYKYAEKFGFNPAK